MGMMNVTVAPAVEPGSLRERVLDAIADAQEPFVREGAKLFSERDAILDSDGTLSELREARDSIRAFNRRGELFELKMLYSAVLNEQQGPMKGIDSITDQAARLLGLVE